MTDLNWLYQVLSSNLGPSNWWPATSKPEIILGAILVQNTNWRNAKAALQKLKVQTQFKASVILKLDQEQIAQIIKPSGFYYQKAKAIQATFRWFNKRNWNYQLTNSENLQTLRQQLLKISGIGPETADVFLVYVFDLPVFIADAYARKLFQKLGYRNLKTYQDLKKQITLPPNFDYLMAQDFHGLIDEFGKLYLQTPDRFATSFLKKALNPHQNQSAALDRKVPS